MKLIKFKVSKCSCFLLVNQLHFLFFCSLVAINTLSSLSSLPGVAVIALTSMGKTSTSSIAVGFNRCGNKHAYAPTILDSFSSSQYS